MDREQELEQELKRTRRALADMWMTLAFYADYDTYFACGFAFDRPCGEFEEDFSEDDEGYPRPGKRARNVLDKYQITAIDEDDSPAALDSATAQGKT
jgi:hypothetical protein